MSLRIKSRPDSHVDEVLVKALPQVVQEGGLAGVGFQQDQVLDAHAVPGSQRALHVPQDPVAPLLQTLEQTRGGVKGQLGPVARQSNETCPVKSTARQNNSVGYCSCRCCPVEEKRNLF